MPARCLNKVILIGNLTRDPELRYTPSGSAVCSFGMATNRYWTTDTGEKKEETQFHRIVAWNKLAEICSQLLGKGDKVYIEGRLQTRQWTGADGAPRTTIEIVASDMILLRSRRGKEEVEAPEVEGPAEIVEGPAEEALEVQAPVPEETKVTKVTQKGEEEATAAPKADKTQAKKGKKKEKEREKKEESEDVEVPEEIEEKRPF